MNILVLIKQVPDTEAKITLSGNKVNETGIKWIISPYDEIALEEAIRIKEKSGGTITVISVGTPTADAAIRTAYAMGADNGILVVNDSYEMLDSFAIAEAILKAIAGQKFDIILAGRQATDSDNAQVPLIIATKLDIAAMPICNKIEMEGDKVKTTCEVEGGEAIYSAALPVLITANDRLNEPRYPSLKGIMAAKKKTIETKKFSELGISASKIQVIAFNPPAQRPAGRIIDGAEAADKVKGLVDALHNEAKLI